MNLEVDVFQIRKRIKNPNDFRGNHMHNFFQFIYILSGEGSIKLSSEIFKTAPANLFLISPFTEHEIMGVKDFTTINISFFCSRPLANKLLSMKSFHRALGSYETSIVQDVLNESVTTPLYHFDLINTRISELSIRTLRDDYVKSSQNICPDIEITSLDLNHEMQFVLNYIDDNISSPLTVSQLSRLTGYSESYFSSCFKKTIGCSPGKFLAIRKLQMAKAMILTTRMNITQISERLGFESIHYFSRFFKNFYGVSPKKFLGTQKAELVFTLRHGSKHIPAEFDSSSNLNTWSES